MRRTEDADPEPRFRRVVWPGGRDDSLVLAGPQLSPEAQRLQDCFDPLIAELVGSRFADRARQGFDHADRLFPSGLHRSIDYAAGFWKGAASVGLRIQTDGNARTKYTFDELYADRASIEAELADVPHGAVDVAQEPPLHLLSINLVRDGAIHDPPERLAETRAWMTDALLRLRAVFDPRLAVILEGLDATDGA